MKQFILYIFLLTSTFSFAQNSQEIKIPTNGKSYVYIVREGVGKLLNFRVYHNDKFIGALPNGKYIVYECDPGENLFWVASENRDFVEANLEPNKTYVLNIEGKVGLVTTIFSLYGLNPDSKKDRKKLYKAIKSDKEFMPDVSDIDKSDNIEEGLKDYQHLKSVNSDKVTRIEASQNFLNADKP
jgi:hypothetical protein